jgi:pimeloyl-ACP methyl ester carboxylesterase
MRRLSGLLVGLALFGILLAPADGQSKKDEPKGLPKIVVVPAPAAPSYKHLDGQMLVIAVNGVGDSTTLSDNLKEINEEKHLRLCIQEVPWTRTGSKCKDLTDTEAQLNAAARIACAVKAIHKDAPKAHIILIGYSAGARVVLAAAEMSPPKSLDRVIVLSPTVSQMYDLTGALKASRYGIDNFYSVQDGVLDTENDHYRNSDGGPGHAAGKYGFKLCTTDKTTIEAYRNVRQHGWTDEMHYGGHYTWVRWHMLAKCVVPQFFTAPVPAPELPKMKPAK